MSGRGKKRYANLQRGFAHIANVSALGDLSVLHMRESTESEGEDVAILPSLKVPHISGLKKIGDHRIDKLSMMPLCHRMLFLILVCHVPF
mmetsp:Transcript_9343/g.19123  ORF Transcript_9343/g.19123 Transcript_9343/m.19123 type:complete len:90 (+) Transcript_9343:453-722(+)